MPGIAGIISQASAAQCQQSVTAMLKSMMHERSYAAATYSAPELGVYGASIGFEEASKTGQILRNEDESIVLLFSGECFPEAGRENDLRKNGKLFGEGRVDWLVHFYEEEGERFFEKLNGLFSGLLIDKRKKRVFLFNDRYGFDRLYLHEGKDAVYFASEAKSLLSVLPSTREFAIEGVQDFLAFGCAFENRTLFRGIELLPGGSLWTWEDGRWKRGQYFNPSTWQSQSVLSAEAFQEQFEERFKTILPRYFESPARLGISLTAGLDTRMIMAARPKGSRQPVCYTYDGPSGATLDTQIAERIAEACGLDHKVLRINPDFFSDFSAHADRTVFVTDGTFGVLGAHEIYLSAKARSLAPIRLTGVFGGEIIRGVSTFKRLELSPRLLAPDLHRSVATEAMRSLPNGSGNPVSFAAFAEIPWNISGSLAACRSQLSFRTPYLDNGLVALAYRAPVTLRKSPLPALRMLERNDLALAAIPTDMGLGGNRGLGSLWRRLWSKATFKLDYLSNEGLPDKLSRLDDVLNSLNSRKVFFGHHKYLRYRSWLRKELAQYLRDSLATCDRTPFWNAGFVRGLAEQHIAGHANYMREINAVLTLSAVERTLLRAPLRTKDLSLASHPR
jgi:asparagine synthase (glutamine-hydrolysing)